MYVYPYHTMHVEEYVVLAFFLFSFFFFFYDFLQQDSPPMTKVFSMIQQIIHIKIPKSTKSHYQIDAILATM